MTAKRSLGLPWVQKIASVKSTDVLACLSDQDWVCFLDSAVKENEVGECSYIVCNPFLKIVASHQNIYVNDMIVDTDPFETLRYQLAQYPLSKIKSLPPFQGGAVGYFSYDLLHYLESVPRCQTNAMNLPEMMIGFYDTVIAFDHKREEVWIISHGLSANNPIPSSKKAEKNGLAIMQRLSKKITINRDLKFNKQVKISSNFSKKSYKETIQTVKDYIYAGDIFQANISQCFTASLPEAIDSMGLYLTLRDKNPAPFSAYLKYSDFSIASASPERFIKLNDQTVETRPIKGTCARSEDAQEDQKRANALLNSEKDRAENIMIVDLMRNDLSRVCKNHSVVVNKLCGLESFETVHHLVSVVKGVLKPGYDAVDVLRATFPGGSITGAPKIRAMEIIHELEPTSRGLYCGSIGYIGFDGAMDTSIVIRTMVIKGGQVTFQAGGGIVMDSILENEYQESLIKARRLKQVLTIGTS